MELPKHAVSLDDAKNGSAIGRIQKLSMEHLSGLILFRQRMFMIFLLTTKDLRDIGVIMPLPMKANLNFFW